MANKPRIVVKANNLKKNIGANLQRLRERSRQSQQYVAAQMGISQPNLSAIERGRATLSAAHFLMLADYFNVSLKTLYKETTSLH